MMRRIFVALIVAAAALNAWQFFMLDARQINRYKALYAYDTADIAAIGFEESGNFRRGYGVAVALRRIAPGVSIVAPPNLFASPGFRQIMYSYGGVTEIRPAELDQAALRTSINDAPILVKRRDGKYGNYVIAAANPPSAAFAVARRKGSFLIVDSSLLPRGALSAAEP